jgi:hypothetical protein
MPPVIIVRLIMIRAGQGGKGEEHEGGMVPVYYGAGRM